MEGLYAVDIGIVLLYKVDKVAAGQHAFDIKPAHVFTAKLACPFLQDKVDGYIAAADLHGRSIVDWRFLRSPGAQHIDVGGGFAGIAELHIGLGRDKVHFREAHHDHIEKAGIGSSAGAGKRVEVFFEHHVVVAAVDSAGG